MKKHIFACCACFICVGVSLYAQYLDPDRGFDDASWYSLEQAYDAFNDRDFGTAFRLVENAKEQWKEEKDWAVSTIDYALAQPGLLKAGDDMESVLNVLRERNNVDAVRIIESKLIRFSFQDFNYSITNFSAYIKNMAYPEADFLLGKLYMIEGEYALSEEFYSSAYKNRKYLDIPDIQFDILADMADLYRLTGDNERYESALLLLASRDDRYKTDGVSSGFLKAVDSAVRRGMNADKLFLLYRNDNYHTLYVWFQLTAYYDSFDLNEKAFETALLFCLTALSRADNIIKSRNMDYTYTTVIDLLHKIQTYPDINEWAEKNKLWEGFYLLGKISKKLGHTAFASDIFKAVSQESPQRMWKVLAQKEL
ncbi:hypothetical protein H0R92_01000 [Treponema sp. OMZ 840]|uniref:hypothetical protein n=1 Tax=Treponema sp. OMZ 840 TaxID=244313 RepID=UPI003D933F1D